MLDKPSDLKAYHERLKRALAKDFLGQTLDNFAAAYAQSRLNAFAGLDFEALREGLARAKDQSLPNLLGLYAQFKMRAEAAGAKVHFAANAGEANRLIASLAREAGARNIVKSKSMTAEETHLNDHLEMEGFKVTETDLGEWIIQLRREGPSHMVMPAIHLSRQEVAELFGQVTGQQQDPEDINAMVKVARRMLREAFLEADLGISGANFAVAESGTIGLVTNEGNARLVTTWPRTHVALVGLEKLVPDLDTALDILKVLPKNATGQAISSYVTWITGAAPCAAGPGGRKDLHIIFLDNGRLALSRDPVFGQALRCIRCGACANLCPIYRLVGGHEYGHVYIGAIGLILTYFYHGLAHDQALVRNCLNCQACKSLCPVGIDLPRLIKKTQGLVFAQRGRPAKNRLLAKVLKNRKLFHFLLRRAHLAQKPWSKGQPLMRHLPLFVSPKHAFRSLPTLAATPLRERWKAISQPVPRPRLKAALFAGCLVDFVYPEQGEALLKLLQGRRVRLDFPLGQTCCGLPAEMASEEETARQVAAINLRAIDPSDHDYVLTLCASCASHLKHAYPRLLADDPGLVVKAAQLAEKVIDFSSFCVEVLGLGPVAGGQGAAVAYHAPCHLCRGLGVRQAPRRLLELSGLSYAPAKDEEVCCGFGGSYSVDFPEISARLLKRKLDNAAATGAQYLVSDCPGCVLQLRGGMDVRGQGPQVRHIVELVAEARQGR